MDALEDAKAAIRIAEQNLRAILVQAAEAGEYDHLPRIAEWAKLLSAAITGQALALPEQGGQLPPALRQAGGDAGGVPSNDSLGGSALPRQRTQRSGRRGKKSRKSPGKTGYPRFVREGDTLVKIAWSKSEGRPYEHKAPRGVLRALIQALARVGAGGERFTMDGLLPLKDGSADIPDYQTYLTLAWLRSAGLVTQHGRQGYSLPPETNLEREVERQWGQMETR